MISEFEPHGNLLQAKKISHKFDYLLFRDLNIELSYKDSMAVIGRSGSGKSTLLHILATLLKPNEGKVEILNKDIYNLKDRELELFRRRNIGIIFQSHYLFKGMSVYDNIEVAALLAEKEIDKEILKELGIDHILKKRVSDISGGQQQRVSIARVLMKKPKIIFADEPTGNLDRDNAKRVIDILKGYINQYHAALFLVTHDLEIAKECNRVYKLQNYSLYEV